MSATVFIDARALQDPDYQFRGIGRHIAALLRNRLREFRAVGLLDPELPELPAEYRQLFDRAGHCTNYSFPANGSVFLNASPMTHDVSFSLRFAAHPRLLTAAIVYDFIPFDWPGYFTQVSERISYLSRLSMLKRAEISMPISEYSAGRLQELLGVTAANIRVTGAAVRSSLFEAGIDKEAGSGYFLTVGGENKRKNTETAIRAVRSLNARGKDPVHLRIVGEYSPSFQANLQEVAGPDARFLEFCPGVDDRTLVALHQGAIATIAPSYIEGFSLPIVEAAVCGSPVLASDCAAHRELIANAGARFSSDNADELSNLLERVLLDRTFRDRLVKEQAHLGPKFHEEAVSRRFWTFLQERFERRFPSAPPAIHRRAKPKIAFLSPYPPEQSGVALYTQSTLNAAREYFEIDLFTNAPRPLQLPDGVRDAGAPGIPVLLKNKYDGIVSVIGDSHFHKPILELFEHYGGPCIIHDSRLTHTYFHRLGETRFQAFAEGLLGRSVDREEIQTWLRDRELPTLFLEPVLDRAQPAIVHTRQLQELLRTRYGVHAELATFCPNHSFSQEELAADHRAAARRKLGIADHVFAISSFGFLSPVKGVYACVMALDLLRSWGIPAELFLVGDPLAMRSDVEKCAANYGVGAYLHLTGQFAPAEQFRDFMLASDAAIQLRTYGYGQASAALADCISAGIPTVASESLAEACDGPSYVPRIPDNLSALLLAERLADLWETRTSRTAHEAERAAYCREHSFERYAARLSQILDLA